MLSNNKTHKYLLFLAFVFFFPLISFGQAKILESVLKKNEIGKVYSFDSSTKKNGCDKIFITYLGRIKMSEGKEIYILSWSRIWGKNRHTSGTIFIYDNANKCIGKYTLGSSLDLPAKFENGNLIFKNKNKSNCDSTLVTKIDFSKGIPKDIFIKCKGSGGDIYSFSKDK